MDWYWIVLIVVAASNVYCLVAWMMADHVWGDWSIRPMGIAALLWPVVYPLYIFVALGSLIFQKER